MKFYVLKHPEKGFLKSKKYFYCSWTDDIQWAKKWSYPNHPKNVIIQTTRPELAKCSVVEIDVFGFAVLESDKHSVEMDFSKMGKYEL